MDSVMPSYIHHLFSLYDNSGSLVDLLYIGMLIYILSRIYSYTPSVICLIISHLVCLNYLYIFVCINPVFMNPFYYDQEKIFNF